ncbi:hypothetical protein K7432_000916 [Basidiobolus ranarum]|uniref:Uncharacterized protein n=1 Tax=Basidiobolus ranarum TaxID=34480 RepID=A0ABR2X3T0_9FUNG
MDGRIGKQIVHNEERVCNIGNMLNKNMEEGHEFPRRRNWGILMNAKVNLPSMKEKHAGIAPKLEILRSESNVIPESLLIKEIHIYRKFSNVVSIRFPIWCLGIGNQKLFCVPFSLLF